MVLSNVIVDIPISSCCLRSVSCTFKFFAGLTNISGLAVAAFDIVSYYLQTDAAALVINDFHKHLNRQNADIQFNKEIEENSKIPFLDCLVLRINNDNKLSTTVYRRPTHTDRLLDQSSYNPTSHKAVTISKRNWFVTHLTVSQTKTTT